MVPSRGTLDPPSLLAFLKSPQLDLLAKAYGLSYDPPPMGLVWRETTHSAKGGYKVMVETLEDELKKSPLLDPRS